MSLSQQYSLRAFISARNDNKKFFYIFDHVRCRCLQDNMKNALFRLEYLHVFARTNLKIQSKQYHFCRIEFRIHPFSYQCTKIKYINI